MLQRTGREPAPTTSDSAAWALLAATTIAIALLELRRPLPIEPSSSLPFLLACMPLAGIALFYSFVRPRENFATMALTLLQVLLFSALGCVLQYLLAREGGTRWDARLAGCDQALGLDWIAYVRWVDTHPFVAKVLELAYAAMIPEVIAVVLILGIANRIDQLRTFMLAGMICGAVTILMCPLFPSVSGYVFFGIAPSDFHHVNIVPGYQQWTDLSALRHGTLHAIRLPELQGIIAFPSYHAGLATVNAWGIWSTGNRWLRWPGMIIAAATIVSAPVFGGHYFVDILAGIAIAVGSIFVARRLVWWRAFGSPLRALPFRHLREAFAQ